MSKFIRRFSSRREGVMAADVISKGMKLTFKNDFTGTNEESQWDEEVIENSQMYQYKGTTVELDHVDISWGVASALCYYLILYVKGNDWSWNEDVFVEEFIITEEYMKQILKVI